MNDREALGDCDFAGVDEKIETLPVLLLFAVIESKSSDALIGEERSVNISYSVKVLSTTPFCSNQQAPVQTFLWSIPKFWRHRWVHSDHFYELYKCKIGINLGNEFTRVITVIWYFGPNLLRCLPLQLSQLLLFSLSYGCTWSFQVKSNPPEPQDHQPMCVLLPSFWAQVLIQSLLSSLT